MIIERPEGNKLLGIYRGKVVQHLPHGKLKVFIPTVYSDEWEINPDKLPTAEQLTPLFAGSVQGNGVFSYPNIGSIVMCQFINGDQNYPLVIGATLGGPYAFGQYSHIYDSKMDGQVALSTDIDKVNHSSPSHLITAGKTHLRLFEDGRISAITMTPTDVPTSVDFQNNTCKEFPSHEINTQLVMSNVGEISASTNDYKNNIFSEYIINIDGKFKIDTYSPSISCLIEANTQGILTVDVKSNGSNSTIVMNQNGIMEINTTDKLNITTTNEINMTTNITNINSPGGVNIVGNTHITGSLVTTGTTTDCGCTLATHKHPEQQSGDVVSPGVMTGVGIG